MSARSEFVKTDYPYIRAWGKLLGSYPYYVHDQIEKAKAAKAPQNAIYEREGVWVTFDQVTSESTRITIEKMIAHPENYGL